MQARLDGPKEVRRFHGVTVDNSSLPSATEAAMDDSCHPAAPGTCGYSQAGKSGAAVVAAVPGDEAPAGPAQAQPGTTGRSGWVGPGEDLSQLHCIPDLQNIDLDDLRCAPFSRTRLPSARCIQCCTVYAILHRPLVRCIQTVRFSCVPGLYEVSCEPSGATPPSVHRCGSPSIYL